MSQPPSPLPLPPSTDLPTGYVFSPLSPDIAPNQSKTLREYLTRFRLINPVDGSMGANAAPLSAASVARWPSTSYQFTLDSGVLEALAERLQSLDLDAPVTDYSPNPSSTRVTVDTDCDIRYHVEQLQREVDAITRGGVETPGVERAVWPWVTDAPAGLLLDRQLMSRRGDKWERRKHFTALVKPSQLRRTLKPFVRALAGGNALTLARRQGGNTELSFAQDQGNLGKEDMESLETVLRQLVDVFVTRGASCILVSDAFRWVLFTRLKDIPNPNPYAPPIWRISVSPLLGNDGPIEMSDAPDALAVCRPPAVLTELPIGLWLAISIILKGEVVGAEGEEEGSRAGKRSESPPSPLAWSPPRTPNPRLRASSSPPSSPPAKRTRSHDATRASREPAGPSALALAVAAYRTKEAGSRVSENAQEESSVGGVEERQVASREEVEIPSAMTLIDTGLPNKSAGAGVEGLRVFSLPVLSGELHGPWLIPPDQTLPIILPLSYPSITSISLSASPSGPIVLGAQRSYGRLWEVFEVLPSSTSLPPPTHLPPPTRRKPSASSVPTRMLAKLASPHVFPCGPRYYTYSEQEARDAIARERRVMSLLGELQGTVIPTDFGLWGGVLRTGGCGVAREVWMMLVEDCGESVELDNLTAKEKTTIVRHYKAIHRAGILHRDVELRHWLRHPSGGIRIIDFDSAKVINEINADDWDLSLCEEEAESIEEYRAMLVDEEMRSVRRMLGMKRGI